MATELKEDQKLKADIMAKILAGAIDGATLYAIGHGRANLKYSGMLNGAKRIADDILKKV
ncbi:hypothetical protein [Frateuria aurantia]|uniref:hypothetical protein n=1 Tax=Frateuria aurantia TaxID=81475 RepID=UPI0012EA9111|nr:hypothetical protein [Frateuria aurantia]